MNNKCPYLHATNKCSHKNSKGCNFTRNPLSCELYRDWLTKIPKEIKVAEKASDEKLMKSFMKILKERFNYNAKKKK